MLQEAEEALVSMADEKVEAAETRAELRQEKASRAAELRAANWFYFAEATAWAEGESAEASAVVASRQEETRVMQQQENSLNAATAEVAAFKAEAASMRKEALGLRGDLGKEEVAFQQADGFASFCRPDMLCRRCAWQSTELVLQNRPL